MTAETLARLWRGREPGLLGRKYACAVLCPFAERADGLHLIFEVRAASLRRQGGEVCFPGGRIEPGETAEQCALRETREELAIPESAVTVIGEMDFLYIRSHCLLRPVLAVLDPAALEVMRPDPAEVADTLLLPLSWLRDHPPEVYIRRQAVDAPDFPYDAVGAAADYPWRPHYLEVPVYRGTPHPLWGLTARITMEVVAHL